MRSIASGSPGINRTAAASAEATRTRGTILGSTRRSSRDHISRTPSETASASSPRRVAAGAGNRDRVPEEGAGRAPERKPPDPPDAEKAGRQHPPRHDPTDGERRLVL